MVRSTALWRLLVPEPERLPPVGFTLVETELEGGLPHRLSLGGGFEAMIVVPNGLARTWHEREPGESVGSRWLVAARGAAHLPAGPPVRLLVRRSGALIASVPVVAGVITRVPDASPTFEMLVLDWHLAAGTLRGPGVFGSHLSLAYRRSDRGSSSFEPRLLATAPGDRS